MTLPSGWAQASVNDLGEYLNGMAFKPTDWSEEGIGIIRIQNLTNSEKPLNRTQRTFDERYRVTVGDILVSWSATLDAYLWDRDDSVLNQHIFKVAPAPGVDKAFLFALLKKLVGDLAKSEHLHGSTMKHINRGPFLAHPAALPPLAEQGRIVAKLDVLSSHIARARIELGRVPILADKLRSKCLSALWRAAPRCSLSNYIASPIRNGLSVKGSDAPPGVPALRLSSIRTRTVDLSDVRYLPIDHVRAAPYTLAEGDVVISRGNGTLSLVGKASRVDKIAKNQTVIFPDTAFRLRLDPRRASPRWLTLVWNSAGLREQIEARARTTAGIWKISQRDLNFFSLPELSVAAQEKSADLIEATFARADRLEAEAARARQLLDRLESAILAKAFRGELVPQDPKDEPADKLLERIRAEREAAPKPKRGRRAAS
jgi:type I restriction enzyme S subunit